MNRQEQAFLNGFVKRASEYGVSPEQAIKMAYESTTALPGSIDERAQNALNQYVVQPISKGFNSLVQGAKGLGANAMNFLREHSGYNPVTPQMQAFQKTQSPEAAKAVNVAATKNYKALPGSVPTSLPTQAPQGALIAE